MRSPVTDFDEQSSETVAEFLGYLRRIDGALALGSLLLGRQRPHRHRLAQAIDRIAAVTATPSKPDRRSDPRAHAHGSPVALDRGRSACVDIDRR
jgi:hypothetical protein